MIFQINITRQAEDDLRNVFEYIAYELQSVQNAAGQLGRLEKAIFSLDQMPMRYRAYEKEPWHSRGLRVMPVDNYLVFYIPYPDTLTVEIIRVMYGGRDILERSSNFDFISAIKTGHGNYRIVTVPRLFFMRSVACCRCVCFRQSSPPNNAFESQKRFSKREIFEKSLSKTP